MFRLLSFIVLFAAVFSAFADESSSALSRGACSRLEKGKTIFYAALHEAFEAAAGSSIDAPDEIILLADCILESPLIIPDEKHIRLVSDGSRIIARGRTLLEYPLFWIHGNNASLSLGKPEMAGSFVVDGGYLNSPPIEAKAPIVAVNGLYSKFVLYDKVTLQNNYSVTDNDGSLAYKNGAGVFIRTYEGRQEAQAEFIMKGGIIQGNFNNAQNPVPFGGGVLITSFGLFTMEGGSIMNNTAYGAGGGVYLYGGRGSLKKTGGIIYGKDAPAGYRNIAVTGEKDQKYYGHAVCIMLNGDPIAQYRNDTVRENDFLSYTGSLNGNGVFGEGDNWDNPVKDFRKPVMIILSSVVIFAVGVFLLVARKISRQKAEHIQAESTGETHDTDVIDSGAEFSPREFSPREFSPREREIFDMLLTGVSTKEIADTLKLTYSGVNFHIQNIYGKLGIQSRTELLVKYRKSR